MKENEIRDIYNNEQLQHEAFTFAERNFPQHILNLLTGQDEDGNKLPQQNIKSLLNQVENMGNYTSEEWEKFFEEIRENGI